MRLLLVEDDPTISRFLLKGLREDHHVVDLAEDGPSGIDQAVAVEYDAIVLDLMLPGLDGFEVCRHMRDQRIDSPILVISARHAVGDRVRVLDCGADDYLTKPFAFEELLARLRALDRRGRNRQTARTLSYGPLTIDPVDHRVTLESQTLTLTHTEYRLLEYLDPPRRIDRDARSARRVRLGPGLRSLLERGGRLCRVRSAQAVRRHAPRPDSYRAGAGLHVETGRSAP